MSESIFGRVQRVVSSGLDAAVGAVEQLSGTALMRQALHEMEDAIAKARSEAEGIRIRRLQAAHQIDVARKQLATLKEQARFAVGNGREDLAEAAIGQQIEIEARLAALGEAEEAAEAEERQLEDSLVTLETRRVQMADELDAFQAAKRAAAADPESPKGPGTRSARKAARAEHAFRRAMKRSGPTLVATSGGTAEAAAKLAEIEALQKEKAVAERLAALRPGQDKPAPKKKARG